MQLLIWYCFHTFNHLCVEHIFINVQVLSGGCHDRTLHCIDWNTSSLLSWHNHHHSIIMLSPVFFSFGKGQKSHGAKCFLCGRWSKAVKCLIIWRMQFQWVLLDGVGSHTDVHTVIAINNPMNIRWQNIICSQKLRRYGVFISHLHHLWLRYFSGCNWENYSGKTIVLDTELGRVKLNECSLVHLVCWFVSQKTEWRHWFSARLPVHLILCGHICKITD